MSIQYEMEEEEQIGVESVCTLLTLFDRLGCATLAVLTSSKGCSCLTIDRLGMTPWQYSFYLVKPVEHVPTCFFLYIVRFITSSAIQHSEIQLYVDSPVE